MIPPRLLVPLALSLMSSAGAAQTQPSGQSPRFTDTFIGFRYGSQFYEPNNPKTVAKRILQLNHLTRSSVGQDFFNIDFFQSDGNDPANGTGSGGATEIYLAYRHQFRISGLTNRPTSFGPVREVVVTAGGDLNTKNSAFAPRKQLLIVGPTLKLKAPGFVDVSLWYAREWNHCGLPSCTATGSQPDIAFDPSWMFSTSWGLNRQIGKVPVKFQGFVNYSAAKGLDNVNRPTAPETLTRSSVMADLGSVSGRRRGALFIGVGYEYWHNKFGNHDKPGVTTSAPMVQFEWHF